MRKMLYSLLVIFAVSTNVSATEYDVFVGVEAGLSSSEFSDSDGKYENNEITTYGARIGAVSDISRVYLSYQYMDAFEGSSVREGSFHAATINVEGLSDAYSVFDSMEHTFFIGAHLGGINLDVDAPFVTTTDEYGALYGFQGGVITTISSILDIELGYRYSFSDFNDDDTDLDNLTMVYAGINVKF